MRLFKVQNSEKATAIDIDKNGGLIIKKQDGTITSLHSGEISIRELRPHERKKSKSTVYSLILCALFAALIAVGAFIKIPVPFVPFTPQLLFTTLAGIVLGPKYGALSVGVYILIGLLRCTFILPGRLAPLMYCSPHSDISLDFNRYICNRIDCP